MVSIEIREKLVKDIMRKVEKSVRASIDKLGVCADSECGQIFIQKTRKQYCSTRCQSRVFMRKYRNKAA